MPQHKNTMKFIKSAHLGTAGGIGAVLLWSTSIAFNRSISEQLGPVTAAGCVYTVSALLGLFGIVRSAQERRKLFLLSRKYLFGCGFLFVIYMLCLFLAIGLAKNRSQAVEVGLINYLWPALTLVFSVPVLGNRAGWILLPGTALALFGVFYVLTGGDIGAWHSIITNAAGNPGAYLLALAAALTWGLYSTLTRKWAGGGDAGGAVPFFLTATALVMLSICAFVDEPRVWNIHVLVEVILLGVITYAGYSLWDFSMREGNAIFVAASSYLTPLFSTIVSCIYLSVSPTASLWLGCLLLVVGSLLSWLSIENGECRIVAVRDAT